MPQDEPTMGEVIRRLDAIARQLTEVVREIKDDRAENAKTFVRQDVYVAQRLADQAVTADVAGDVRALRELHDRDITAVRDQHDRYVAEKEDERRAELAFRRQVIFGFVIAGVGWLLTIAIAVATLVMK